MSFWDTFLIGTIPALITSLISYTLSSRERKRDREKHKAELEKHSAELKMINSELMVINSAKHFLEHKTFTDRSFKTLKKYLGGWDNDEDGLRRVLVSAGAVRVFPKEKNHEEWWYLLSRAAERIEKKKAKRTK